MKKPDEYVEIQVAETSAINGIAIVLIVLLLIILATIHNLVLDASLLLVLIVMFFMGVRVSFPEFKRK